MMTEELAAARLRTRELRNGYAFSFPSDAQFYIKIAEWVTLETLCCPFLKFSLEFDRDHGPLWLRLTGRRDVKTFLREYLSELQSASGNLVLTLHKRQ